MTDTQKLNIYNLKFEDFCLLVNPRYLGCMQTEKAFYGVQALLKRRKWSELIDSRYSWYFVECLMKLMQEKELVIEVINEIEHLENPLVNKTNTKIQTQFKHEPLKDLWHKHYHLGNWENINHIIIKPLLNPKKWKKVKEEVENYGKYVGKSSSELRIVLSVLKKITVDEYESKMAKSRLTGEWIIYHEVDGKKYYLGLWNHGDDEKEIFLKVNQIFNDEFLYLRSQLSMFSY